MDGRKALFHYCSMAVHLRAMRDCYFATVAALSRGMQAYIDPMCWAARDAGLGWFDPPLKVVVMQVDYVRYRSDMCWRYEYHDSAGRLRPLLLSITLYIREILSQWMACSREAKQAKEFHLVKTPLDTVGIEPSIELYFSKILKQVREQQGMSQDDLAMRAELHHTYISLLERGLRHPSLHVVIKLAHALQIKPSEFLSLLESHFPNEKWQPHHAKLLE